MERDLQESGGDQSAMGLTDLMNKRQELINNGYMRLAGYIRGVFIPKRCRVCSGELDAKYKKRGYGYLCLSCLRERRRK